MLAPAAMVVVSAKGCGDGHGCGPTLAFPVVFMIEMVAPVVLLSCPVCI